MIPTRPTYKTYKFYLRTVEYGEFELSYNPSNWKDEFIDERHKMFRGLFRTFSKQTLSFSKDGYIYLKKIKKEIGINANIYIRIERIKNDWTYKEIFNGKIITHTLKFTDILCEAEIEDIDGLVLLNKRKKLDVNLNRLETLSGEILAANTDILTLPEQKLENKAQFELDYATMSNPAAASFESIPYLLIGSDIDDAQQPIQGGTLEEKACYIATSAKEVQFLGNMSFIFPLPLAGQINFQFVHSDADENVKFINSSEWFTDTGFWDYNFTRNMEVGDMIHITFSQFGLNGLNYLTSILTMTEAATPLQEIEVKGIGLYNAFERCIKIISDLDFESTYLTNNHSFLFNGINIRGSSKGVTTNLEDLINSAFVTQNLALGFENNKIRVEPLEYWFEDGIGFDMSDRILPGDVEIEYDTDFFNMVEIGYDKYILDYRNGLTEFNTITKYSCNIEFDKKRSIKSNYRADTIGIAELRGKALITNVSESVSGDDDIFIISCYDNSYLARTNQGYDIYPEGWYNLDYSPARLIRLHQIANYTGSSNLTMEYKPKLANIISQKTGGDVINENADIDVTELMTPIYKPEIITVNTYMTKSEIDSLPKKEKIKISDEFVGYILSIKYNYKNNDIVELKLLRAWL